jgi:Ni,Fe-hydrogenase I large subunit
MFRGLEMILKERDPRDAWMFAQRACGVCTTVHALASVRAVENALGITIPENARLVRNLIAGTQFLHDHVIPTTSTRSTGWTSFRPRKPTRRRRARSRSRYPLVEIEHGVLQGHPDWLNAFRNGLLGSSRTAGATRLHPRTRANLLAVAHYRRRSSGSATSCAFTPCSAEEPHPRRMSSADGAPDGAIRPPA